MVNNKLINHMGNLALFLVLKSFGMKSYDHKPQIMHSSTLGGMIDPHATFNFVGLTSTLLL